VRVLLVRVFLVRTEDGGANPHRGSVVSPIVWGLPAAAGASRRPSKCIFTRADALAPISFHSMKLGATETQASGAAPPAIDLSGDHGTLHILSLRYYALP